MALLCLVAAFAAGAWWWREHRLEQPLRDAQAALGRHDLSSAATHLTDYLQMRPDDDAALLLAGRTARRLGRYAEAEQHLERCQEVGGVTDATRLEWDLLRVQRGDLGDIHTRLRMTIPPEHPDAPLVLEALARGYLIADRLRDVVEACDLWSVRQPEHPWPRLWRGGVFERLGNFHQALTDYQSALERAPDDLDVHLSLGGLYARARRPDEALEHFEQVLKRSPDHQEALLGIAAARLEQGRPDDAAAVLGPLLHGAAPPRACFLRGKAALAHDNPAIALHWLERAAQLTPADAEVLHQLALALRAGGKDAEADRLVPRVEALRKDSARLDELVRIIARSPDDAGPRHEAGVLALRLGRTDDGMRYLEGALQARGDHRPVHAALAEHYRRQGDPRAAVHAKLADAAAP
jgi:tetratricopeptide (TPR) repeat protein